MNIKTKYNPIEILNRIPVLPETEIPNYLKFSNIILPDPETRYEQK